MKTTLLYLAAFICSVSTADLQAQKMNPIDYLDRLPQNLIAEKSVVHTYRMSTDYKDYDLKGNFIRKTTIEGDYTCGLKGDSVRWNNVFVSEPNDLGVMFTKKQDYLENFTYMPTTKVLSVDFFKNMPEDKGMRMKNMVWDMYMLQEMPFWYWNSLTLNNDFDAAALNDKVDLAGEGTFENKDMKIKWLGVTKIKDEVYAIIKYTTLNNKVSVNMENITMDGRSHYWGEIYVSLVDKHIECATLTEDVITDLQVKGQPRNLNYGVRSITLKRVR